MTLSAHVKHTRLHIQLYESTSTSLQCFEAVLGSHLPTHLRKSLHFRGPHAVRGVDEHTSGVGLPLGRAPKPRTTALLGVLGCREREREWWPKK